MQFKYTLSINGMMCGMCEAHVNDIIRRTIKNASKISSSHVKNKSEFVVDEKIDEELLKEEIAKTGYKVEAISCEPYEKKGLFSIFKKN